MALKCLRYSLPEGKQYCLNVGFVLFGRHLCKHMNGNDEPLHFSLLLGMIEKWLNSFCVYLSLLSFFLVGSTSHTNHPAPVLASLLTSFIVGPIGLKRKVHAGQFPM